MYKQANRSVECYLTTAKVIQRWWLTNELVRSITDGKPEVLKLSPFSGLSPSSTYTQNITFRNPALLTISGAGNKLTDGSLRTRYSQPQSVLKGPPVCLASRTWRWKQSWLPKLCFNYKSVTDKIKKSMLRNIIHQRQSPKKMKTKVIRETPVSVQLCSPQIPYRLAWDWTQA